MATLVSKKKTVNTPGKRTLAVRKVSTLFDFLLDVGYKRTKVKQLLKYGSVAVNDKPTSRHDHTLVVGDRVSVNIDKTPIAPAPPPLGMEIIYEDDHLIVISKPSGLLTISTEKEKTKTAYFQMNSYLREREPKKFERVFIVHRLDRDTSGLLLFAKSERIKKALQENWQSVTKKYFAVVEGTPSKSSQVITSHLKESKTLKVHKNSTDAEAKYAATEYEVIRSSGKYTLLDVDLLTGRKNQIRVHLADMGNPVAGDRKYGAKSDPLKRLALHAYLMSFSHPVTGKALHFKLPAPKGFLKYTRKYH